MAKASDKNSKKAQKEAELIVEAAPEVKPSLSTKDKVPAETEAKITQAESVDVVAEKAEASVKSTAKAGKRSAKAQAEVAEKEAKENRKRQTAPTAGASEPTKPRQPVKPARSRLERRGKNYKKASELIDKSKTYPLSEALDLAIKTNPAKFDASVELHFRLNVDPRQADQNIRDNLVLPAGSGKVVRVAAFVDADAAGPATQAGADIVGADTITEQLEKNQLNFDILIAPPTLMARLGKYARLLGPKGLMPNPKSGTVTTDIAKAVQEAKAGRVEYRVDSTGIVHLSIGKVSFGKDKLQQNAAAVIGSIRANKPASVKSNYIKSFYVTTAMGPSIAAVIE